MQPWSGASLPVMRAYLMLAAASTATDPGLEIRRVDTGLLRGDQCDAAYGTPEFCSVASFWLSAAATLVIG